MRYIISLSLILLIILFSIGARASCTKEDIKIISFTPTEEDLCTQTPCPHYKLVGEIQNTCDHPIGVELNIAARDQAGKLVDTFSGWPASTNNISSGDKQPFNFSGTINYNEKIKSWDISVESIKQW